ncbi:MAG: aminopeptidase [Candidatus Nanoarchaeia archaeon]|nr:aminopeptidase [Candidatus Nanoarchaeia archaeon]
MEKIAADILKNSLNLKKNQKVLIITDNKCEKIGEALFKAAKKVSKEVILTKIPVSHIPGTEPPKKIASFMQKFDVVLAPTWGSLTHTKAVQIARKKGVTIATLPGITGKIMKQSMTANFKKVEKITQKLYSKIKNAKKLKITTPSGTNIILQPRRWILDTGIIKKSEVGNLPGGELFCAPKEKITDGIIVVDSFRNNSEVFAPKGTSIVVVDGEAIITTKNCKLTKLFRTIKNSTNIAEFGIGTNYKAKVIGNILQDEKVLGTCHIAFGNNTSMGGKVYSKMHLDCILFKPTIYADKKIIMKKGKII